MTIEIINNNKEVLLKVRIMNSFYIVSSEKSRLNNIYRIHISNDSLFDFSNKHSINDPTTQIHFNTTCNDGQEILDHIRKRYPTNLMLSNDGFDQYVFQNIFNVINYVSETIKMKDELMTN